jgi:hypothetical protein
MWLLKLHCPAKDPASLDSEKSIVISFLIECLEACHTFGIKGEGLQ